MKKQYILFSIIALLLIVNLGVLSATSWTKVTDYNKNDVREVTFKNWWGFGGEQGKVILKSHELNEKGEIQTLKVGLGNQVTMYYDFNFKELIRDGLGEVEFIDMKTGNPIERDYKYVYLTTETKTRDVCSEYSGITTSNGTRTECSEYSKENYNVEVWKDYNSKDIPIGNIRIGIEVETKQGDYIDGIWNLGSKKIDEHATWNASLETDLVSWYKLDETTGDVIDSHGSNDGTNDGATRGVTGKINNAFDFDYTEIDGIYFTGSQLDITGSMTIGAWIKAGSRSSQLIVARDCGTAGTCIQYRLMVQFSKAYFMIGNTAGGAGIAGGITFVNDSEWHYVVGTFNLADNNVSIWVDGNYENSATFSGTQASASYTAIGRRISGNTIAFDGLIDEVGIWDRALTDSEVENLYNEDYGCTYQQCGLGSINPIYPTEGEFLNTQTINFTSNISVTDLKNVSLVINGTIEQTNSSGIEGIYNFTETLSDGYYNWTIIAYDDSDNYYDTITRTFTIDVEEAEIEINSGNGTQDYGALTQNHTINFTATDDNLDECWYEYNGTNSSDLGCSSGVLESVNFTLQPNTYSATIYANDTAGNLESYNVNWSYKVFENSRTHNTTSYETAYEGYEINLTANSSLTAIKLNYNGTQYSMTNEGSGIWSYARDLPTSTVGNNSINFNFTYDGDTINSDYTTYQDVQNVVFNICNGTYTTRFLNISFKDESDLSSINASIQTSNFEYYLGSGEVTKTYTYSNSSNNYYYEFCASPTDRTFNVNSYIQYKQGTDYPQRIWDVGPQTYTNTTTDKTLYLLSSLDGIYVTFQVINTAEQPLIGVDAIANRTISGEEVTVAQATTGASGTVTFWLNPDFSHDFSFSKTGYETYSYSDTPTQTGYTITLSGGTSVNESYFKEISYLIRPNNESLINDTTYTFGFQLNSSFWDVDEYGFNLRLRNGTIISGGSTGTEATLLTLNYNTNNQTRIYMDYYWLINGTYTNATFYWNIYNTEYTQWSISTFFTDLSAYLETDLFGLDDFGRSLIIFMFIFISIGMLTYRYGMSSPVFVASLTFGVIFFFDVGVNFIPEITLPNGVSVEHLLTAISGFILAVILLREVGR